MANYKYIFERPYIDKSLSNKMMDFDLIQARAIKAKRFRLIRNSVVITAIFSALIFMVVMMTRTESGLTPPTPLTQAPAVLDSVAESAINESENQSELELKEDSIPQTTTKTDKPEKPVVVEKEAESNEKKKEYKIMESEVVEQVVVQAEPKIGFAALYEYFNDALVYPSDLAIDNIEGNIVVEFTITKEGKVEHLKLVKAVHQVLDSISLATVKNMPKWNPASVNGEAIDTKHTIPLSFNIANK